MIPTLQIKPDTQIHEKILRETSCYQLCDFIFILYNFMPFKNNEHVLIL